MSKLFAFGLFLLISNFVVGKAALPIFAVNFYLGLSIYLLSWLMLFTGVLICGKEGWVQAKAWYTVQGERIKQRVKHFFK
jgi:hypothetical protein